MTSKPITELTIRNTRHAEGFSELKVRIDAHGQLVLEGAEAGESVRKLLENTDYQYTLTIPSAWKDTVLLHLIKDRFQDAFALSDWCREHFIPTDFESES